MRLKCIIVDDERHALRVLQEFIRLTPLMEITGIYTDPLVALSECGTDNFPDIAFLDVDMPGMNGLELAAKFNEKTKIVFTTSFREYAADAYEQAAEDYLLKPISYERFQRCVTRLHQRSGTDNTDTKITVKDVVKGALINVEISEIIYIRAELNYKEIHLTSKKVLTYFSMENILKELPDYFCRIHRSYIINLNHVRNVFAGSVEFNGGLFIPIGRLYRKSSLARFRKAKPR